MKINVDFEFDFEKQFEKAFADDKTYQDFSYFAKCFNVDPKIAENAIRILAEANVQIFTRVMTQYNYELLNEIIIDD